MVFGKVVSKGKITDASKISRVIAKDKKGEISGLATFKIDNKQKSCELVSIDSVKQRKGIGTIMLKHLEKYLKQKGIKKVWLITTNDNLEAASFYINNGYRLIKVHKDALNVSRKLKPQIPLLGKHNIPLTDGWEFEKYLSD